MYIRGIQKKTHFKGKISRIFFNENAFIGMTN